MHDKERIIDKIVKLFKLGHADANTTEAEMMAAITRARTLMAQHQISMAEVEMSKGKSTADAMQWKLEHYNAYTRRGSNLAPYDQHLAAAVGTLTQTRPYLSHRTAGYVSMVFFGDEGDVQLAGQIFLIWLQDIRRMARDRYGRGRGQDWSAQHTAYAVGVADRLQSRARELVRGLSPAQEQTWALVVQSKSTAIASAWNQMKFGKVRRGRSVDPDAYHQGLVDGQSFNMNTKVIR